MPCCCHVQLPRVASHPRQANNDNTQRSGTSAAQHVRSLLEAGTSLCTLRSVAYSYRVAYIYDIYDIYGVVQRNENEL